MIIKTMKIKKTAVGSNNVYIGKVMPIIRLNVKKRMTMMSSDYSLFPFLPTHPISNYCNTYSSNCK